MTFYEFIKIKIKISLEWDQGVFMCGIVGYLGKADASAILLNGLKRLEYRGYDSAGIAVAQNGNQFKIVKEVGKIRNLEDLLGGHLPQGNIGIGHTRWATHGKPSRINAHPHSDNSGNVVLIHNGIIENFSLLKKALTKKGHRFESETDTEVIAHLIEEMYEGDFEKAFREALLQLEGTFGIAVLTKYEPDKIFVARKGSPIVIGIGEDEYFVASDVTPLIPHTKNVFYLDDDELAIISRQGVITKTIFNKPIEKKVQKITFEMDDIEKGDFEHFMLKEIFEQPDTIMDAMRGRLLREEGLVRLGGLAEVEDKLLNAEKIFFTASGTSWHAALLGEYLIEEFCRIPVEVEYASELDRKSVV